MNVELNEEDNYNHIVHFQQNEEDNYNHIVHDQQNDEHNYYTQQSKVRTYLISIPRSFYTDRS